MAHIEALSPQQRSIAEYVLDHLREVPFLSVPQLAERSGASDATVVRLCQSVGYSGFSDLKMALVESLRGELEVGSAVPAAEHGASSDALSAVAELEQHNIRRTVEGIDRALFDEVATALFRADHLFTFGIGISSYLAELAAYLFTEHGFRATALSTRFTSPREQLVALRPSDLVLAFSFRPYSRQTLEVLEEANARGVQTVAISDRPSAPAALAARLALSASTHSMMFANATAAVEVLLNGLLVQIASQHRGETVEALSRINRVLRDPKYLVDGEE